MKKQHLILLLLMAVLAFGCGDNTSTDTGNTPAADSTASAETTPEEIPEEVPEEAPEEEVTDEKADGAIVRLSEGLIDPYRVVLALKTAEDLAATNQVLVYFDMRSIDVVLKGAPAASFSPFPDSDKQIEKLKGMGVLLRACGPCLEANWKKPEDLVAGVSVLNPEELTTFSSGRIVTLNY